MVVVPVESVLRADAVVDDEKSNGTGLEASGFCGGVLKTTLLVDDDRAMVQLVPPPGTGVEVVDPYSVEIVVVLVLGSNLTVGWGLKDGVVTTAVVPPFPVVTVH